MENHLALEFFIPHEKEGEYLTVPFQMPENTAEFSLQYHYPTHHHQTKPIEGGRFTASQRINIIDLGLIGPEGEQVGASGSDKDGFFINAQKATPGYSPHPLTPGEWSILVGAYQVAPQGVTVTYQLTFTPKKRRLFLGDLHTHTIASDGVLSLTELASHARSHGLDFLGITDHNQMADPAKLNEINGITLIPGVEWTHFQGHANFLGVAQPYDLPFFTHTFQEVQERFQSANKRGALIVINHPCDDQCGFHFDLDKLPYDCLEIWNGPMRESNLHALGLWQSLLASGKKIPAVGGSDYHRDHLFQILGGPSMGVYAVSNNPKDILAALRTGCSFITFAPDGPQVDIKVGEARMGDTVPWQPGLTLHIQANGLQKGDILRMITTQDSSDLYKAPSEGKVDLSVPLPSTGFARIEIHRTFLPGLPPLPALISNPVYFSMDLQ
jgi:hypothetical protein